MMNRKAITVIFAVAFAGLCVLCLLQKRENQRLAAESADLRSQLDQASTQREGTDHLEAQLKAAVESSEANEKEVTRLRGQAVRLRQIEQENAQLKTRGQQLEQQLGDARSRAISEAAQAKAAPVPSVPPVETTDLGPLEMVDGAAERFDLGGGTNCVVTPKALSDGNVALQLNMTFNNADGTATELGQGRITARPGQSCSISIGDRMIGMSVKLKQE
jgi:hypothetical protein